MVFAVNQIRIESEGVFEGIHYVYCSGNTVRPDNFFKRNLLKFRGLYYEFFFYRKFSKERKLAGVIVSTNSFHNILFYYFLGKIFRVITVVDNVEYWTSNTKFKGFEWIDKMLYDKYYYHFADKVICISDFLISKVGKSRDKIIKIPAITDFDRFITKNDFNRIKGDTFCIVALMRIMKFWNLLFHPLRNHLSAKASYYL